MVSLKFYFGGTNFFGHGVGTVNGLGWKSEPLLAVAAIPGLATCKATQWALGWGSLPLSHKPASPTS